MPQLNNLEDFYTNNNKFNPLENTRSNHSETIQPFVTNPSPPLIIPKMNFSIGDTTNRHVAPIQNNVTNPQAVNSWQATGTSKLFPLEIVKSFIQKSTIEIACMKNLEKAKC